MSIYTIDMSEENGYRHDLEQEDPTLNGRNYESLQVEFHLPVNQIDTLFLSEYQLGYITRYVYDRGIPFRIVTHLRRSSTCYEKARLLGRWDPLNVIKALYFECPLKKHLYGVVVPETGCFLDRSHLTSLLGLPEGVILAKAQELPANMRYGTCSPFITPGDLLANGGKVAKILFDSETLVAKKHDTALDDFSFGLDHRFSLHMNYYHCYKMLKAEYKDIVFSDDLMPLAFAEKFNRRNGKIKIGYDFKSLNYRTAKFINSIHGFGDVSVENDYVDELDLPEVLTSN